LANAFLERNWKRGVIGAPKKQTTLGPQRSFPGTLGLFIRPTLAGTISVWRALRKANVQMCEIPATARGGQKTASNSVRFSQHQQENGARPR
jgi:hypothetical protein